MIGVRLQGVQMALRPVLQGLEPLQESEQEDERAAAPAELDHEQLVVQMQGLYHLLGENSIDAVDQVAGLAAQLKQSGHGELVKPLVVAAEGYDFDRALQALQTLADKLKVTL